MVASMAAEDDPATERELARLAPLVPPEREARFRRLAAEWEAASGRGVAAAGLAPLDADVSAAVARARGARLAYGAWRRAKALGLPGADALRDRLAAGPGPLSPGTRQSLAEDYFLAGRRDEGLALLNLARPEAARLARRAAR